MRKRFWKARVLLDTFFRFNDVRHGFFGTFHYDGVRINLHDWWPKIDVDKKYRQVFYPLSGKEAETAENEGWGLFAIEGDEGDVELQKLDEAECFQSDGQAWDYLLNKAREGSQLHKTVREFLYRNNPEKYYT